MPAAKSAVTKTGAAVRSSKRKEAPASTGAAAKKSREATAKPSTKNVPVSKAAAVASTSKKGTSGKTGVKPMAAPATVAKKSKMVAKGKAAPAVKKTASSSPSEASPKQAKKITLVRAPIASTNVAAKGKGGKEVEAMDRKSLQALAKSLGLKANAKTSDLLAAVLREQKAASASSSFSPSTTTTASTSSKEKGKKPTDELEEIPRAKLVALAKRVGVKANLGTAKMIAAIRAKQSASSSSTFSSSSTPAPPSRRQSGATTATAATTEEGEWEEDSPPREGRRSSTRGSIPPVPAYLKCKDVSPSFDRLAYIKNSRMTARENERKAFIFRKTSTEVARISKSRFVHSKNPDAVRGRCATSHPKIQQKRNYALEATKSQQQFKARSTVMKGGIKLKPKEPRFMKENRKAKMQEAAVKHAVDSMQKTLTRPPKRVRTPVKQGLKSAGLIRRRKFVDSASIKRQALYEKNRLQALKETSKE
ncbi:Hypothetical protein NocV09_08300090 [Nannochloropsis oceanica]